MSFEWTEDIIRARLAEKSATPPGKAEPPETLEAYREAAAVRSWFDPQWLRPAGGAVASDDGLQALLRDCSIVYDEQGGSRWTLNEAVRRRAVQRLGSRDALLRAWKPNSEHAGDGAQQMIDLYLTGEAPPAGEQTLSQLSGTLQVIDWYGEVLGDHLPDRTEVRRWIDSRSLYEPFLKLVDNFSGRQSELARLRDYVGAAPPGSSLESISRTIRAIFSLKEKPPLLIYGPGGVGKSTLVARFILDHVDLRRQQDFPFAYLNFERATLRIDRPLTLVRELVRQLVIEYPEARGRGDKLLAELDSAIRDHQERELDAAQEETSLIYRLTGRSARSSPSRYSPVLPFVAELAELVRQAADIERQPFLLVLDTFEEVQYKYHADLGNLHDLLESLQSALPALRVVIAGRAPIEGFRTEQLRLAGLPAEVAAKFLERRLGSQWSHLAGEIVDQVGTHPLSLRLAAELLEREGGPQALADLETRHYLFFRVGEDAIQNQLQMRILDHIHHPAVARLARFGVVLRQISVESIAEVLIGSAGLDREALSAEEYFDELSHERSLVRLDPSSGALGYLQAIRPIMLQLVRKDHPETVARIHRRAVAFFKARTSRDDQVEELYHRLALGQTSRTLDRRWLPGAEQDLGGSFDELSMQGKAYLLGKIDDRERYGIHLTSSEEDEILAAGDAESWVRTAARRVQPLLESGEWEEALRILQQRQERTRDSKLLFYEAQALEGSGRIKQARQVASAAVTAASAASDRPTLLSALTLQARIEEKRKNLGSAQQSLEKAALIAREMADPLESLPVSLQKLLLLQRRSSTGHEQIEQARSDVATDLAGLTAQQIRKSPSLSRVAARELGGDYSELASKVLKVL